MSAATAYHFSAGVVARSKGHSAIKSAAYIARADLRDERTDERADYSRKQDLVFEGIFAPDSAPEWAKDRGRLWNEVEKAEKRNDAQLARRLIVALPHQLTDRQRQYLITDFCRESFQRRGMIADVAIHAPHKEMNDKNHHAHILLTMRRVNGEGFGNKERDWNRPELMEEWRAKFAHMAAKSLERAGFKEEAERWRHGHKTLDKQRDAALARGDVEFAQRCDREAQQHLGPSASAMERRGEESERGNENRERKARNDERQALKEEAKVIDLELERERRNRPAPWMLKPGGLEALGPEDREKAEWKYQLWAEGRRKAGKKVSGLAQYVAYVQTKWQGERPERIEKPEAPRTDRLRLRHLDERRELDRAFDERTSRREAELKAFHGLREKAERIAEIERGLKQTGIRSALHRLSGGEQRNREELHDLKAGIEDAKRRIAAEVEKIRREYREAVAELEAKQEAEREGRESAPTKGRSARQDWKPGAVIIQPTRDMKDRFRDNRIERLERIDKAIAEGKFWTRPERETANDRDTDTEQTEAPQVQPPESPALRPIHRGPIRKLHRGREPGKD
jgi:hypothetical protein